MKSVLAGAALMGLGFSVGTASAHDISGTSNPSGHFIVKATPERTGVRIGMVEQITHPGKGPPFHTHTREDEIFYIASGRIRFFFPDKSFVAEQGDVVLLPRRVPHTFQNAGLTDSRVLFTLVPDGLENFFAWRNDFNPSQAEIDKIALDVYGLYYSGITPPVGPLQHNYANQLPLPPPMRGE